MLTSNGLMCAPGVSMCRMKGRSMARSMADGGEGGSAHAERGAGVAALHDVQLEGRIDQRGGARGGHGGLGVGGRGQYGEARRSPPALADRGAGAVRHPLQQAADGGARARTPALRRREVLAKLLL